MKDWRIDIVKALAESGIRNSPGQMRVMRTGDDRLGDVVLVTSYYASTKPNDPIHWVHRVQKALAAAGVDKRTSIHPSSKWVPWYYDEPSRDVAVVMDQPVP